MIKFYTCVTQNWNWYQFGTRVVIVLLPPTINQNQLFWVFVLPGFIIFLVINHRRNLNIKKVINC